MSFTRRVDEQPRDVSGREIDGRYVLESVIGAGAMGVVCAARHKYTGARVAVKLARRDLGIDPEIESRFLVEARAPTAIDHRGVVKIFDAGKTSDGELYLVMELLSGISLRDRMADGVDTLTVRRIGLELLDALDATHARGVIHRDLKPENVFLVAPDGAVKVLDFGLTKMLANASARSMTVAGLVFGTITYMAPEQLLDASTADARADLWAIAVILYELLAGRRPHRATTLEAMYVALVHRGPDPISSIWPEAPPEVSAFFERALARDPAARFPTAREMAHAFAHLPLGTARGSASGPQLAAASSQAPRNHVTMGTGLGHAATAAPSSNRARAIPGAARGSANPLPSPGSAAGRGGAPMHGGSPPLAGVPDSQPPGAYGRAGSQPAPSRPHDARPLSRAGDAPPPGSPSRPYEAPPPGSFSPAYPAPPPGSSSRPYEAPYAPSLDGAMVSMARPAARSRTYFFVAAGVSLIAIIVIAIAGHRGEPSGARTHGSDETASRDGATAMSRPDEPASRRPDDATGSRRPDDATASRRPDAPAPPRDATAPPRDATASRRDDAIPGRPADTGSRRDGATAPPRDATASRRPDRATPSRRADDATTRRAVDATPRRADDATTRRADDATPRRADDVPASRPAGDDKTLRAGSNTAATERPGRPPTHAKPDRSPRSPRTAAVAVETPSPAEAAPPSNCAAGCKMLESCHLGASTCMADCARSSMFSGCLAQAGNDCNRFASCYFAWSCNGRTTSGNHTCAEALDCESTCTGGNRDCMCGCIAGASRTAAAALLSYNGCALGCKNDAACIATRCAPQARRCRGGEPATRTDVEQIKDGARALKRRKVRQLKGALDGLLERVGR